MLGDQLTDKNIKILLLISDNISSRILYNYFSRYYENISLIVEERESSLFKLKRRVRKLGLIKVLSQLSFRLLVQNLLKRGSKKRIAALFQQYCMEDVSLPQQHVTNVIDIHDEQTIATINRCRPDIVIANGTRIIKDRLINAVNRPILHIHLGITPMYRGAHGGYWALADKKRELFGVTVHMIDKGIDTGTILAQKVIDVGQDDNLATYPYLQLGEGLPLLRDVVEKVMSGEDLAPREANGPSRLHYNPGIFEYIFNALAKRVY